MLSPVSQVETVLFFFDFVAGVCVVLVLLEVMGTNTSRHGTVNTFEAIVEKIFILTFIAQGVINLHEHRLNVLFTTFVCELKIKRINSGINT